VAPRDLARFAFLSIAAALVTMVLKLAAWLVTGSVGLLSDALESSVNLVAAVVMLIALRIAARPADETHEFGHDKAELFSAGAEGSMIIVAAAVIIWTAVARLLSPAPLQDVGVGLAISLVAAAINLLVSVRLQREGRRQRSLALVADGKHLMTDVWTSAGVLVGIALVWLTGWERLDPLIALAVGVNIVVTGGRIVLRSAQGLMDPAMPAGERAELQRVLARYAVDGVSFHELRTRTASHRRYAELHVLVPGRWTVRQGHDLIERIERELEGAVEDLTVTTHLEPVEDPRSHRHQHADAD
jgi:cation diffusion facilitator family transporter